MVKYILGLLTGFCLTVWYLVFDLKFNFDHAFTLNLIIAAGTITATAIHFDSVRKQRKDRVWEINKESHYHEIIAAVSRISGLIKQFKPL